MSDNTTTTEEAPPPAEPTKKRTNRHGRGAGALSAPLKLRARERDLKGLRLRQSGMQWQQIVDASKAGEQAGTWPCSFSSQGHAYNRVMTLVRELPKESADEYRALLTSRCEDVIRYMMPKVIKGDARAANVMLRAVNMLRSMHVPELPQTVNVTVQGEFESAMKELLGEMEARAQRDIAGGYAKPPVG